MRTERDQLQGENISELAVMVTSQSSSFFCLEQIPCFFFLKVGRARMASLCLIIKALRRRGGLAGLSRIRNNAQNKIILPLRESGERRLDGMFSQVLSTATNKHG